MKKWIGISVAVILLVLTGMSWFLGKQVAEKSDFGIVHTDEGHLSQVIHSEDRDFVLYQEHSDKNFQIVNTDKALEAYQTVGTVHHGEVYYLFGYIQNQKQFWGIEPIGIKEEKQKGIPALEAEGKFLAAGSTETEILISILGIDQMTITEYMISLDVEERVWTERSTFCLTDENRIRCAAYEGNKFIFQQDDGKVFCRDVIVEELETVVGTVLAAYYDKGLADGAEHAWRMQAITFSMGKCLVPSFIVAMLIVLFLYGSSQKEPIVYRMLCYTEVATIICFIVVGYLCAITMIEQESLAIEVKEEVILHIKNTVYVLIAIVSLIYMLAIVAVALKWKKFTKAMEYVATEKTSYNEIPSKNDGLQMVWSSLDSIGKTISRQNYEKEILYKNYHRFLPKDIERLLEKVDMTEIELGDHRTVNGCMVNCLLDNIKDFDASQYMSVMTNSLNIMHKVREKHGGIFHSAGSDLLERKIFFEKDPKAALSFVVELIHTYVENGSLKNVDFVFMLHVSNYYYGISGVNDMVSPFMFCKEEKIIEPYTKALLQAKVKIALTEQTLALVGDAFSVRYIGFLSNKELGNFKIYECLDAYSESKRQQMEATDAIFQNALELFYSNDFYLARNAFNEVLKGNEQDQIARWYLFHCEYHLNHPEAEITYGLFDSI